MKETKDIMQEFEDKFNDRDNGIVRNVFNITIVPSDIKKWLIDVLIDENIASLPKRPREIASRVAELEKFKEGL